MSPAGRQLGPCLKPSPSDSWLPCCGVCRKKGRIFWSTWRLSWVGFSPRKESRGNSRHRTGLSKNGEVTLVQVTLVLPTKSSQKMGLSPVLPGPPSYQSLAYGWGALRLGKVPHASPRSLSPRPYQLVCGSFSAGLTHRLRLRSFLRFIISFSIYLMLLIGFSGTWGKSRSERKSISTTVSSGAGLQEARVLTWDAWSGWRGPWGSQHPCLHQREALERAGNSKSFGDGRIWALILLLSGDCLCDLGKITHPLWVLVPPAEEWGTISYLVVMIKLVAKFLTHSKLWKNRSFYYEHYTQTKSWILIIIVEGGRGSGFRQLNSVNIKMQMYLSHCSPSRILWVTYPSDCLWVFLSLFAIHLPFLATGETSQDQFITQRWILAQYREESSIKYILI